MPVKRRSSRRRLVKCGKYKKKNGRTVQLFCIHKDGKRGKPFYKVRSKKSGKTYKRYVKRRKSTGKRRSKRKSTHCDSLRRKSRKKRAGCKAGKTRRGKATRCRRVKSDPHSKKLRVCVKKKKSKSRSRKR